MAQFDLKHATIRIKDGYAGPGGTPLVNNVAGYAIGATTMIVNGYVGAVAIGDLFTLVGHDGPYKITAHSETTSNTTSITFTPALTDAVVDDAVIAMQPHELEVNIGEGTLTYSEKRKIKYVLNRGRLDTVRQEDEEPVDVRIDFMWEFIRAVSGSGTPTVEDALKNRGEAATWISSSADPCEPFALDIEVEYIPPCTGEYREIITLNDYRYESLDHDTKAGTLSTSGKCNITEATVVRAA